MTLNLLPSVTSATIGGTVKGDPVKDIIQTAFENGINLLVKKRSSCDGNSFGTIPVALILVRSLYTAIASEDAMV